MTTPIDPSETSETAGAQEDAAGAVPPTGGVPPEDAPPAAAGAGRERSASEDLTDGIDLIRRAARKAMGSLDPRIEAAAERALKRLQQLDQDASAAFERGAAKETLGDVERLANDVGRDIESFVGRIAARVETALSSKK